MGNLPKHVAHVETDLVDSRILHGRLCGNYPGHRDQWLSVLQAMLQFILKTVQNDMNWRKDVF
jgi:hypothetical protein